VTALAAQPLVSVVVPTRNRRAALERALMSVERQTVREREVLVVDDASEDDTADWLRATRRPGLRTLRLERRRGAAAARNAGLALARGECVAFLDDDDRWHDGYLAAQLANLGAHQSAALSYAGHVEIDARGRRRCPDTRPVVDRASPLVRLLAGCFIHTLSVIVARRAALLRVGGFDESLAIVHDLDLYARLLLAGEAFVALPARLVERSVPGGLVLDHAAWFDEERRACARALAAAPSETAHAPLVAASRALFFARLGLARRDFLFASERLRDALSAAPGAASRLAARRLLRRLARARVTRTQADRGRP
jgi:glycosyltransferase involved in cell wall biosynthesis